MKNTRSMWKWVVGLVVVAALALAGTQLLPKAATSALAQTATATPAAVTQDYVVKTGDITASISVAGQVYAPHQVDLTFDASGIPITAINVKMGQPVKAGDVLAKLDTTLLQGNVDKAKANLLSAQNALETAQNPYTDIDKQQAAAAVTQAKANLEAAKKKLSDLLNPDLTTAQTKVSQAQTALIVAQNKLAALKADPSVQKNIDTLQWQANELEVQHGELLKNTNPSEEQRDYEWLMRNKMLDAQEAVQRAKLQAQLDLLKAQHDVVAAQQALEDAQTNLANMKAPSALDIAVAQNAVSQAEYDLAKALDDQQTILAGPDPDKVKLAQTRYNAAKAAYDDAVAALKGATMVAPFDGTVVSVNAKVGDLVTRSSVIVTLADLSGLRVLASVDETQIPSVQVGQPVALTFDALPGKRMTGQVLEVPLDGKLSNNVVVYSVDIDVKDPSALLKPGMTANVQITLGSKKGVLLVPALAVITNAEGTFVNVREANGTVSAVPIQIGLKTGTYVEVTRGLNAGDTVVITYKAASTTSSTTGGRQVVVAGDFGGPPPGQP